ncbi:DUF4352 domain-containing protein [Nocardia pseudovaccinii]|uniref:DUF4352 domain-containing protein n=1 Tax=Nocardia pseudovaccinii TaxID=189540 RepID=UPI003D8A7338
MNYQNPQHYPYYQGIPPRPIPPPKTRLSPDVILLLIVGGIILLCGAGALTGTGSKKAQPTPAAVAPTNAGNTSEAKPAATTSVPPAPGLNTPVRDGKFEFVVTDVQSGMKTLGTNPYLQKTAQGSYTIVSITVRNTSKVPYGFSPSDQYVFDTQNRKFGNDSTAAINLQADTSLYADINPGNSITAQVAFDLPADAEPDHIVLHDSMFSGGVTVSLR